MATQNPFAATDVGIFRFEGGRLQVFLVDLMIEPFIGSRALPGTLVRDTEDLTTASERAYREAMGQGRAYFEQVFTFSGLDRDPRQRSISTAYMVLPERDDKVPRTSKKYARGFWCDVDKVPDLAFDHKRIVEVCVDRIRAKLNYSSIALLLLPQKFTLTELQTVYEYCLDRQIDKRNFRKKMLSLDLLEPTELRRTGERARPAMLYRAKERDMKVIPLFK